METGSKREPGTNCCSPLLPWLQPLELRRKKVKIRACGNAQGRAHAGILCLKGFYLFSAGRNFRS